ncbi:MAG: phosphoribosylformylglycinamidine synthase subunit PurS [Microcella sp.]|uniref:phosphoribosylformylglycinamidine synthase subunit PurS n=1 Tax=Microcella sp. TaxID=1913979 RepID=UPI00331501D2
MPTIVVEVMPKPELLDPAGKAVAGALHRLGHDRVRDVRIGKRFELTVDTVDEELLASIETVAADILSNDVIETVLSVEVLDESPAGETH